MAINDLFDQKCDIYHLEKKSVNMGYGIYKEEFSYSSNPDIENIDCHFSVDAHTELVQTSPANEYLYSGKVVFPIGTDIRLNDMVVERSTKLAYYAQVPRNIRNHHISVIVQRKGTIQAAL